MTDAPSLLNRDWLEAELADTLDEEIEAELEDVILSEEIAKIYK